MSARSLVAFGGSSVSSGQEPLPGRVPGRDLLELNEIGKSHMSVGMKSFEVRAVPQSHLFEFSRPGGLLRSEMLEQLHESGPIVRGGSRGIEGLERLAEILIPSDAIENAACRGRPDAGQELKNTKT